LSGREEGHARPAPAGRAALIAYLLLALTALIWASNFVIGRAVRETLPPIGLSFWRWAVACAVLVPIHGSALVAGRRAILRDWRYVLALGVTGAGAFHTLVYLGVRHTEAINAALIMSTTPVVIVALSWLMLGERITARQGAGIGVSLVGVLAIVARGDPATLAGLAINPGDGWILASVPIWALYSVLVRRRPAGLAAAPMLPLVAVVGALALLPFAVAEAALGAPMPVSLEAAAAVLYLGLAASIVAFVFWNRGVETVGANRAGLFLHLVPAFATALAILFLGETARPFHGAGIALILAGIYLTAAGGGMGRRGPAV